MHVSAQGPHAPETSGGEREAAQPVSGSDAQGQDWTHRGDIHPTPAQQKYDQEWAAICRWLDKHELIMHIPMRGPFWFECKRTGANVERGFRLGT